MGILSRNILRWALAIKIVVKFLYLQLKIQKKVQIYKIVYQVNGKIQTANIIILKIEGAKIELFSKVYLLHHQLSWGKRDLRRRKWKTLKRLSHK